MRYRRSIGLIIVAGVMVILLAACGSTAAEPIVQEEPVIEAAPVEDQAEAETGEETSEGEPVSEEPVAEAVSGFTPGFELGDSTMIATDPSTVNLVSGQIQVLEFFAFW